jgi:hypothetical protein
MADAARCDARWQRSHEDEIEALAEDGDAALTELV